MRVLVSCVQMQKALPQHRNRLESLGLELVVPEIPGQQLLESDLLGIMPTIDGVIAGDDQFTARVFEHSPRLKVLSKWGIGTDSIDKTAAARHGVVVTNTPGVFGNEVADMALAYVLLLGRGLHLIDAEVRAGRWPKVEGESFRGQTAQVVGLGSIGRAIVARLLALGMTVLGSDPHPDAQAAGRQVGAQIVALDEGLSQAAWLVLAAPLTTETTRLIDAKRLARLPRGAHIINVSRGQLVVETDLVDALRSGQVGGAGLDVYEVEPLPFDSPLRSQDNVVFGAHNGSNTRQAVARTSALAVENLLEHLLPQGEC